MIFYLLASELFQALPLLVEAELGASSKALGASSSSSSSSSITDTSNTMEKIYSLLVTAEEHGDCIAPYFINYMNVQGYGPKEKKSIDLKIVPQHLGQGDKWIEAYKIYIQLSKDKKKLDKNLKALAKLKKFTPLANLFLGMFAEKNQDINRAFIHYQDAAGHPNLWGMKVYRSFLQKYSQFVSQDRINVHKNGHLEISDDPSKGYVDLFKYCQNQIGIQEDQKKRFLDQYALLAFLHGEIQSCPLMFQYARKQHPWKRAISEVETFKEANKWFEWICVHEDKGYVCSQLIDDLIELLRDPPSDLNLEFILSLFNYVTSPDSLLVEKLESYKQLIDLIGPVCRDVCKENPVSPILMSNYHFCVDLGLSFERDKNYLLAEVWYRKALTLHKDQITLYNVANILRLQNKKLSESIELFFKAAELGCNDSVKIILHMYTNTDSDILSIDQLSRLMEMLERIDEPNLVSIKNWLKSDYEKKISLSLEKNTEDYLQEEGAASSTSKESFEEGEKDLEESETFPLKENKGEIVAGEFHLESAEKSDEESLHEWEEIKYPTSDASFEEEKDWGGIDISSDKEERKERVETVPHLEPIKKVDEESLHEWVKIARSTSQESLDEAKKAAEPNLDLINNKVEESPQQQKKNPPILAKEKEIDTLVARAIRKLSKLNKKLTRELSVRDLVDAKKYARIILGEDPVIAVSLKGKSSGSRIQIGGQNIHLPHGRDRLSPGLQHDIKKIIKEAVTRIR